MPIRNLQTAQLSWRREQERRTHFLLPVTSKKRPHGVLRAQVDMPCTSLPAPASLLGIESRALVCHTIQGSRNLHRERDELLAGEDVGEELLLHLCGAVVEDWRES